MSTTTSSISNDDNSNKLPATVDLYEEKSNNDPFRHIESISVNDIDLLFDQPPATRAELWSYYLYYNGVKYTLLHISVRY